MKLAVVLEEMVCCEEIIWRNKLIGWLRRFGVSLT